MQPLKALSHIAGDYDAFLLDLWGVIHDGSHLYPGVRATLTALKECNKKLIFVSNAPRRVARVEELLVKLGIESSMYDAAMSSGEAGYRWAAEATRWGKHYYYIGPAKDRDVLNGLDYEATPKLDICDFLLNVGYGSENHSDEDMMPVLAEGYRLGKPMLCLNPDLEVVKISGERYPCAGVIGRAYEELGGEVVWFGKPYPAIYQLCFATLGAIAPSRILAVGDSLNTDIPGAQQMQIDSLLITGGILKDKSLAQIQALCAKEGLNPTYVAPSFSW